MTDNAQQLAARFPATLSARQVADTLGLQLAAPFRDATPAPFAEGLVQSATGWQRLMLLDSDGFTAGNVCRRRKAGTGWPVRRQW